MQRFIFLQNSIRFVEEKLYDIVELA